MRPRTNRTIIPAPFFPPPEPNAVTGLLKSLPQRAQRLGERTSLLRGLLLGVLLLSLLIKLVLIYQADWHERSILKMEYGFGPVITALYEKQSLEACGVAYALDFCGVAGRMPLLPFAYAELARLIGTSQGALAFTKTLVFQALLGGALLWLFQTLRGFPLRRLALVLIAALTLLGPQYLKHSISVQYEESLLLDLFLIYFTLLAVVLTRQRLRAALSVLDYGILILLALSGCTLYFIKSSLVLFGLIAIAAPVWLVTLPRALRVMMFLPLIAGLVWWGSVNYAYHGEVRLGSSYNGENLYRGQNPYTYKMYPEINLDRIIDSREVQLNSGEVIKLPDWTVNFPKFKSEWEWHDYFAHLGKQWMLDNPQQALELSLRKLWVLFLEPGKVPFRQYGQPGADPLDYSLATLLAGAGWIVLMRVLFFMALGLALWHLLRRDEDWRPALFFLLFVGAYAAPYAAGFAYQRHVTPLLVLAACYLPLLTLPRTTSTTAAATVTPSPCPPITAAP